MHLVHRRGGTPCWILFSLAVPGFALPNRFRAVVAVRIAPVEGPLVVQLPYILSQRQRSPAAHLVRRTVRRLVRIFILAVHALDLS